MKTLIIGICGGSCSGKTTIAKALKSVYREKMTVISHDDYYLPRTDIDPGERKSINFDHPAALDTPLLIRHLKQLKKGQYADCPIYDFVVHDRKSEVMRIDPAPLILVDGILIFENEELRNLFDLKVFVDTDGDLRIVRRIMRDMQSRGRKVEEVIDQYMQTVKPMHNCYVQPYRENADIVLTGEDLQKNIQIIQTEIEKLL